MYQTNHPDRGRLRRFFSRTLLCTSAAFLCTGAQTALAELKQPHIVRPAEVLPFGSGVGSAFRPAFRDATGSSLTFSVVELDSNGLLLDRTRLGTGLWEKYQQSLMKETKRSLRRDPSLFWPEHEFEDEIDARRERYAERIFGKANNRLLSGMAEMVIDQSPRLRNAYDYISGFEFGGKRERSALDDREGDDSVPGEARSLRNDFRVVVSTRPRLQLRSDLPGGFRSTVELSVLSPGIETSISRHFAPGVYGTLSLGLEDLGEDRWISASVRCRF